MCIVSGADNSAPLAPESLTLHRLLSRHVQVSMQSAGPQQLRDLKSGSEAARLLGLRVRIPPVGGMDVCLDVCCQVEASASD